MQIILNPVVAQRASGNTYSFPFDVVVHETAGRAVTISIAGLGYSTNVPANGELRYHFAPQKSVTDDRLFASMCTTTPTRRPARRRRSR